MLTLQSGGDRVVKRVSDVGTGGEDWTSLLAGVCVCRSCAMHSCVCELLVVNLNLVLCKSGKP